MKATLVIAAYKEDMSWLNDITNTEIDIVIINKGTVRPEGVTTFTIDNYGVCDHSFCYYLSNFYEQLREYTIFIQANPFDHYKNTLTFINEKQYEFGFTPLADKRIFIPRGEGTTRFVENIFDVVFLGVNFPCGAQYSVPAHIIKSRPKSFYDNLLHKLIWKTDSFVPYFMERTWPFVYSPEIGILPNYADTVYFTSKRGTN